jgi:hypothetical protein
MLVPIAGIRAPGLRLAWLVAPDRLLEPLATGKLLLVGAASNTWLGLREPFRPSTTSFPVVDYALRDSSTAGGCDG